MRYGNLELEKFDKLWNPKERDYLMNFLQTQDLIKANYGYWRTEFSVDGTPTALQADGSAPFKVANIEIDADVMTDFATPLADTTGSDVTGGTWVLGTIPYNSKGLNPITAAERLQMEKLYQEFGSDSQIVANWVKKVQTLYNGFNARLSNMSAQLVSKGKIETLTAEQGKGMGLPYDDMAFLQYVKKYKSGTKAFTDPDCKMVDQLVGLVEEYRDDTNYAGAVEVCMEEDFIRDVVLTNAQVKEEVVKYISSLGNIVIVSGDVPASRNITMEEFNKFAAWQYSRIAGLNIKLVKELQKSQTLLGVVKVKGWDTNKIVIKPMGLSGVMKRTEISDITAATLPNPGAIFNTAIVEGGLLGVVNSIITKGKFAEWHTDVYHSCVPALTQFLYHGIVDATAGGGYK